MTLLVDAFTGERGLGALQRASVELQRHGTPAEVREASALADGLTPSVRDWLRRLDDYCALESGAVAPHERTMVDESWVLYRDPRAQIRAQRELVIGFAGASGNLFQPVPVVLQRLDPDRHDLLVLRDPRRTHFLDGAGGTASFAELLGALRALADDYSSVLTMGASSGAFPALVAASHLDARRGIGLGGRPPSDPGTTSLMLAGERPGSTAELVAIFGADYAPDREGATGIRALLPSVHAIAVEGCATHNVPHVAFQHGALESLYELLLTEDSPLASSPVEVVGTEGWIETIRLRSTRTPPDWAAPERSPDFWVANTFTVPRWLHRILREVPVPARLATVLERVARTRFGIIVNFRRLGTPLSRSSVAARTASVRHQ